MVSIRYLDLMSNFSCTTYGKWILSGEHTVLRQGEALVFPVKSKCLELIYTYNPEYLSLNLEGECGEDYKLLFWGLLDHALEKVNKSKENLCGEIYLKANLPVGAGLGASAALCVAMGRWFVHLDYVQEKSLYEFCRSLEDLFHGESSGVDIAVTLAGEGIRFKKGQPAEPLKLNWQPNWYLSYSGQIGVTSECIRKVKSIIESDPKKGVSLDNKMQNSTALARMALLDNCEAGVDQLKEAMDEACDVFKKWQLTEGALGRHLQELKDAGAIAVKPTGSGGGGYVLSLWPEGASQNMKLIKI